MLMLIIEDDNETSKLSIFFIDSSKLSNGIQKLEHIDWLGLLNEHMNFSIDWNKLQHFSHDS